VLDPVGVDAPVVGRGVGAGELAAVDVGWALGFALVATGSPPAPPRPSPIAAVVYARSL